MPSLSVAWSKLQWSLAQRGAAGTVRFMLARLQHRNDTPAETRPAIHPFDQRYGVDTSGLIGGGELRSGHKHDLFNTAYYGMAPSRFEGVMAGWLDDQGHAPIEETSFIDLGCGKGRAVLMASLYPFRQVVGVELNQKLARIAERNRAAWMASATGPRAEIRIFAHDATEYQFPKGPCLLYLFNPFAAPVVRELIRQIELQFQSRPGELDIIYFNPESGELFEERAGFERLWIGTIPLSNEDAAVDMVASVDDLCGVYRWVG